jgi:putative DNA primase/helicase
LVERFTATCNFQKWSVRDKEWRTVDCPKSLAEIYLSRIGRWELPALTAIATAPVLQPDGRIIDRRGYDATTGVFFDPQGVTFEPVPPRPTKHAAEEAPKRLKTLFATFPFDSEIDRAVALSGVLTLLARFCFPHAPAHCFTAPVAGTGKSMVVDVAAIIATGPRAQVCDVSKNPEEFGKALGAVMMTAPSVISLDNIDPAIVLDNSVLNQCLTQPMVQVRVLSQSKMALVRIEALTVFANGNNLVIGGDMTRRALRGAMDPGCERPELKVFDVENPLDRVQRDRAAFVRDALTVLRAYIIAGCPNPVPALGSFEAWSKLIPSSLVWLDEPNPISTMETVRRADPQHNALLALLKLWAAEFADREMTAREVIEHADKQDGSGYFSKSFRDALSDVAEERGKQRGALSASRLGYWLRKVQGRFVGVPAARFTSTGVDRNGLVLWRVESK